uniref:Integrase n=2 Tax=Magnetospirillum gryphiswaldense TaxID=55518 RepID=A4U0U7_9PROT|nr:Integrase [Magnetospirillum gryphiswaldense MSR-1]
MRFSVMKQAKVLSGEETKRVLSVIAQDRHADRNRMAFQFSLLAGLRACEIASLTIGDVMDSTGKPKSEIYLAQSMTKGKKGRTIMVGDKLQKEVARFIALHDSRESSRPLIASQKSNKPFSANTLVQLFRKIYADAGIDGASSHSGRRSFITTLAEKGVGVRVLQHLAGHSSLATTQRYIDVNDAMLKKAVNLMG